VGGIVKGRGQGGDQIEKRWCIAFSKGASKTKRDFSARVIWDRISIKEASGAEMQNVNGGGAKAT